MRTSITVAVAATILLGACESRTELMRRYKSVAEPYPSAGDKAHVDVGLFSIPTPGGAPRSVLDLSDRAQEKYVEVVGQSASPKELREALAAPFVAPATPSADVGTAKRRIVLSVIDNGFGPADRLDRLEIKVRLRNGFAPDGRECGTGSGEPRCLDASFTGWTLFKTEYDEVDLGTATATQSRSVEANIGLLPKQISEITSLSVVPKVSRDLTEELAVRRRYVKLAGDISRTDLRILQQGVTGIDLVGTSLIDVSIDLGQREPRQFFRFTEDKAAGPGLGSYSQLQPALVCDLMADLTADYRIRMVGENKGDDTSVEGDDEVRYLSGSQALKSVVLVGARELGNQGYVLELPESRELQVLRPGLAERDSNYETLRFDSLDGAGRFLSWLRGATAGGTPAPALDGHRFKVGNRRDLSRVPVTSSLISQLSIISPLREGCTRP